MVPSENDAVVFFVAPEILLFVAAAVFFPDVASFAAVLLAEAPYAAGAVLFSVIAAPASDALAVALSGSPAAVVVAVWSFSVAVCSGVCYSYCCCYRH